MNFANYFTLVRIVIAPLFLATYLAEIEPVTKSLLLIVLLLIAEFSDFIDGYIARKFNQVTDLGKLLDPMADSLYRLSLFLTFTEPPIELPIALVLLFLYRDGAVTTLRSLAALRGYALAARPSGKIKAFLQGLTAFAILLLFFFWAKGLIFDTTLVFYSAAITWIAASWALLSFFDYLFACRKLFKKPLITLREEV